MATIPVVNDLDKRKGIIVSIVVLLSLWIYLLLTTYEMADPPPRDIPLKTTPIVEEIVLKNLKVESGSSGGGKPSDAPISEPKPQIEKVISSKKENDTKVNSGESNVTNTHNSKERPSTVEKSDDPFNPTGGSNDGKESGKNGKLGKDDGTDGSGPDSGPGAGAKYRKVIHHVNTNALESNISTVVYFKVTVDSDGNVLTAEVIHGKTHTSDQKLINRTRSEVIRQLKYNKVKDAPIIVLEYYVNVEAQ